MGLTTIFDAGTLKPKYELKKIIHFIKIQNIHSIKIFIFLKSRIFIQTKFIFLKIQNIHSNKIFIFLKPRIFIQTKYSFFKIQNIHSNKIFIFLKSRIFIQTKYSFFLKGPYRTGLGDKADIGGYLLTVLITAVTGRPTPAVNPVRIVALDLARLVDEPVGTPC